MDSEDLVNDLNLSFQRASEDAIHTIEVKKNSSPNLGGARNRLSRELTENLLIEYLYKINHHAT